MHPSHVHVLNEMSAMTILWATAFTKASLISTFIDYDGFQDWLFTLVTNHVHSSKSLWPTIILHCTHSIYGLLGVLDKLPRLLRTRLEFQCFVELTCWATQSMISSSLSSFPGCLTMNAIGIWPAISSGYLETVMYREGFHMPSLK